MLFIKRKKNTNFAQEYSQQEKETQESLDEAKFFQRMADDAVNKVKEEKELMPQYEREASKHMTPEEIEEEKIRFNNALSQMEADSRTYMSSKAQQDAVIASGDIPTTLRGGFWPEIRENVGSRQRTVRQEPNWTSGQVPQAHQLPVEYQPKTSNIKPISSTDTLKRLLKGEVPPSKDASIMERYDYIMRNSVPRQLFNRNSYKY